MIASREVLEAAAESLPRTPPTERDLEIFAAVRVDCRRQVDVAAEFGISQSRVSQIVRDVALWRAGRGVEADLEGRDRKGVEAWLDAQRLESLYEHTLELYRRSCQPKRRERKGANQRGEWHAETIDHPPGNLQCLRLAARLLELRWKMEEKCPQPSPHALAHADESTFITRLTSMRHWAEVRGEVQVGKEPAGRLVKRLLDELLGRRSKYPPVDPPDSAECGVRNAESQCEAPAGPLGDGVGSLWPKEILGDGHVMPAKDSRPLEVGGAGELGAHTTHIISAAAASYEPADDGGGDAVNDCPDGTWVEATEADGEPSGEEEKSGADMSGKSTAGQASTGTQRPAAVNTSGQASRGTQSATTGRGYAEEERLALAELRRTVSAEVWPSLADHWVTNLLAEGPATLISKGYTREQRQALLGWQRVMELRRQEKGARG